MITPSGKPVDAITTVIREQDALVIRTEKGLLHIAPKSERIFRIRYTHTELPQGTPLGFLETPAFSDWRWTDERDAIRLETAQVVLTIAKADTSITYHDRQGHLLLAEGHRALEAFDAPSPEMEWTEVQTPDGVKRVLKAKGSQQLYHTWLHFNFQPEERLFGLGQEEEGLLNLRSSTHYLHQANRKIAIPFLLSTKGWSMLWSSASPAIFQDTRYGSYFFTEADEAMDYHFIAGPGMDEMIAGYRYLTGKAAMLPRWAYGFIQSQERYETQEELLAIAAEHRQRGIGLDALVLDWCTWPDGEWGQKSLDPTRFGQMKETIEALHRQDVQLMISIWPNMDAKCANHREFAEKQLLLPNADVYDAFSADGRALYWQQLRDGLFVHGFDGWWCDSSEPFTPEWTHLERPDPSSMYHEYVTTVGQHMPLPLGNAYGLVHAQGVYEGQRRECPDRRVLNLTRSGHTGQQRYGVILWSGDVEANWACLRRQIAAGLNMCASGLPYWTLDIGAFFVKQGANWFWRGDHPQGMADLGYQELFVRWYQYGAFLPIFRSHGTDVRREIWQVDGMNGRFYDALLSANRLRYQLMPYLYTLAGHTWLQDSTMMRMLAFDFMADSRALDIDDQFMLGPSLLVCPVTTPMYYAASSQPIEADKTRSVYLPAGADWYDFHSGAYHAGGQTITVAADIDRIPLFVRSGSILPTVESAVSTEEAFRAPLEITVYPGADGEFTLYNDQGDGYGYEHGLYSTIRLTWDDSAGVLTIGQRQGSYPGMPEHIEVSVRTLDGSAQQVIYTGQQLLLNLHE